MKNQNQQIISFLLLVSVLFFYSCQQDDATVKQESGVEFTLLSGQVPGDNGSRINDGHLPPIVEPGLCDMKYADYAIVSIGGNSYEVNIQEWGGDFKTTLIELPPGNYEVTSFVVYDEDDNPIFATPQEESEFGKFVSFPLPYEFTVEKYYKLENEIDVLCVEEYTPPEFGFKFWDISLKRVKHLCIFANYCDPEEGHKVADLQAYVFADDNEDMAGLIWQGGSQGAGDLMCLSFPWDPEIDPADQLYYVVIYINGVKHSGWVSIEFICEINESDKGYLHLNENCDGSIYPFKKKDVFAWEDLITEQNDQDYNDFVVRTMVTGDGEKLMFTFKPLARGAGFAHSYQIVLPKLGVDGVDGADDVTDDGDKWIITIYNDTEAAIGGKYVNVLCDAGPVDAGSKEVTVYINEDFVYNLATPYQPALYVVPDDESPSYTLYVWKWSGMSTYSIGEFEFPNGVNPKLSFLWLIENTNIVDYYLNFTNLGAWNANWSEGPVGVGAWDIDCP